MRFCKNFSNVILLMVTVALLMLSPMCVRTVYASESDGIPEYELVIIEDEAVPLADSMADESESIDFVVILVVLMIVFTVVFSYNIWYISCRERIGILNQVTNLYRKQDVNDGRNLFSPGKMIRMRNELENYAAGSYTK